MIKLREALEEADTVLSALGYDANTPIRTQIKQALAEPLKNYEVGTAEQQELRYLDFCDSYDSCMKCPLIGTACQIHWSHMPYEKESE